MDKEIITVKVSGETKKLLAKARDQISEELGVKVTLGEAVKILAERALKKEAER